MVITQSLYYQCVFTYPQSEEFDVYVNYARTYEEAVTVLQNFTETDEAVEYLKVILYACVCGTALPEQFGHC